MIGDDDEKCCPWLLEGSVSMMEDDDEKCCPWLLEGSVSMMGNDDEMGDTGRA